MTADDRGDGSAGGAATRRRGAALQSAIEQAVADELQEVGYEAATIESIASRAGVSRMSIYRRWRSKADLVASTFSPWLPVLRPPREDAGLRDALLDLLLQMYSSGSAPLTLLRSLASGTASDDDERFVHRLRNEVIKPRLALLEGLFVAAEARGEIPRGVDTALLASAGPALLFQVVLTTGASPTREQVEGIVDRLILPAARAGGM